MHLRLVSSKNTHTVQTSARPPSLNYVESHISCQHYCWRTAKCGGDILNHRRAITSRRFSARRCRPWTLTLTSEKLIVIFGGDIEHPCQVSWKWTFTFRESTAIVPNELWRPKEQTNKPEMYPWVPLYIFLKRPTPPILRSCDKTSWPMYIYISGPLWLRRTVVRRRIGYDVKRTIQRVE